MISKVSSRLDLPSTALASQARAVIHDHDPVDESDTQSPGDKHRPRIVTELVDGIAVSRTYHVYTVDETGTRTEITERCADVLNAYGSSGNLRTTRTYYPTGPSAESNKIESIAYPDGRLDTFTHENGLFDGGTFTPGEGDAVRETIVHGTTDHLAGIPHKTTREISIKDRTGNSVRHETHVYTGSGYELIQWEDLSYDSQGHLIATLRSDGTQTSSTWSCCGKESDTDARGITRFYTYDDLKRVETATKEGIGTQSDITTSYTYDAAGRQLTETVSAGDLTLTGSSQYDGAGRMAIATDAAGLVTHYAYEQDGRVTTVTRPGNATEITSRYVDGRIRSIAGTGVVSRYHTYGVNPDGTQWTQVNTGSPSSPMWEKTTVDALGRTIRVERPGFSGVETTENFYNGKGQLARTTVTGQADTLYAYDELGNQVRSGLDFNGDEELELASSERISEAETQYEIVDGEWWQETVQRVYAEDGSDVATTVNTQRTRITGLASEGKAGETVSIDVHSI